MNRFGLNSFLPVTILALSSATAFAQGSLNPPGPPGPTMKTLAQIEPRAPISSLPFVITSPGAYYLTTNLTGISGANGITIESDNVDLDLTGFTIQGVNGSLNGVLVLTTQTNVTIHNGTVRDWGTFGVNATNAANGQLERLRASGNGSGGLAIGVVSSVNNCEAITNSGNGIAVGDGSSVRDSYARSGGVIPPQGNGIVCGSNVVINGCSASFDLFWGIIVGDNSTVTGCSANHNAQGYFPATSGGGISAGYGCTIIGCTANNNISEVNTGANGIGTRDGCTIKDCTADANGVGIGTGNICNIIDCTANNNAVIGEGFIIGNNSKIRGCVANANDYGGIVAGSFCYISDNTATETFNSPIYSDIALAGTNNVVIRNLVGTISASAANAVGTIDSMSTLNTDKNPQANFKP